MKLLILFVTALFLTGCATDTGSPGKDRAGRVANVLLNEAAADLGAFAVRTLSNTLQNELAGGDATFGKLAADALREQADGLVTSAKVQRIVEAWRLPNTAKVAAKEFRVALDNGLTSTQAKDAVGKVIAAVSMLPVPDGGKAINPLSLPEKK